jgi:hypothetical protein
MITIIFLGSPAAYFQILFLSSGGKFEKRAKVSREG